MKSGWHWWTLVLNPTRKICRVTWHILALHLLYLKKCVIYSSLYLAQNILLQTWHVFHKFQSCCFILSLKNLFKVCLVFSAFVCLIYFICMREVFDPVECKGWFLFSAAFHWSFLVRHPVSCIVLHRHSFRPHCRYHPSHCLHLKFLFSLFLLKYFLFISYVTQWLAIRSIFRIKCCKKVAIILPTSLYFSKSKVFLYLFRTSFILE